jgi:hypothetical protein
MFNYLRLDYGLRFRLVIMIFIVPVKRFFSHSLKCLLCSLFLLYIIFFCVLVVFLLSYLLIYIVCSCLLYGDAVHYCQHSLSLLICLPQSFFSPISFSEALTEIRVSLLHCGLPRCSTFKFCFILSYGTNNNNVNNNKFYVFSKTKYTSTNVIIYVDFISL